MASATGYVAVIGPGKGASNAERELARHAGAALARAGIVVVTGGLGGVMAAAAAGAHEAGGTSIGLLPGDDRSEAGEGHTIVLPTGLGELRNGLVVRSADCVLAVGGSWGTLSEVALAVRTGTPVVQLRGWPPPAPGVTVTSSLEEAIHRVMGNLTG